MNGLQAEGGDKKSTKNMLLGRVRTYVGLVTSTAVVLVAAVVVAVTMPSAPTGSAGSRSPGRRCRIRLYTRGIPAGQASLQLRQTGHRRGQTASAQIRGRRSVEDLAVAAKGAWRDAADP
jgi:hypothetical protein